MLSAVTSVVTSGLGITSGTGDLNAGDSVRFTLNFDDSVFVDTTNGFPTLSLNDGGTAAYSGPWGSDAVIFSYFVTPGHNTSDLTVTAVNLHGSRITAHGVDATLTGAVTNPAGTLQIDTIAPRVSMALIGASTQSAGSVLQYAVTFTEKVSGVDASAFSLVTSGVTGASIISVTPGIDAAHYTVNVNSGTGTGTIGLNITGSKIRDLAGNGFGGGAFAPQQTIDADFNPNSVVLGDLNRDGKLDLVVGKFNGNTINVLLGNGDGTFATRQTFIAAYNPLPSFIADLDGDTRPDIAVAGGYLSGYGDGTFSAPTSIYGTGGALEMADVNSDGKPDLLVLWQNTNLIAVLLGLGDGKFSLPEFVDVGGPPHSMVSADVNGDNKTDLVVGTGDDTVSVLLGKGDGTFSAPQTFLTRIYPVSVALGDVNGDNKPDLVVANRQSNSISVLLGNGDGTFQDQQTIATDKYPQSLRLADVNGDGLSDIVVLNQYVSQVSVLLGNGDGTFATARTLATGNLPFDLALGDLNGDGRLDIVVPNEYDNTVSVMLNGNSPQVGPAFTLANPPTVDSPTASLLFADLVKFSGDVLSDGNSPITERGILFAETSYNPNPQIGGDFVSGVIDNGGTGDFTFYSAGFTKGAEYSFVAYATNAAGTTYSPISKFSVSLPPVLSGIESSPLAYKANDPAFPPLQISKTVAVTDPDSNNLSKVTIQITSGYQNDANGQDVLDFTDQLGITGSFDATTGTLTLSGAAYVGAYREALRTITFHTSGTNLSTSDRVLTIVATDDGIQTPSFSQPITRTVTVSTTNTPPALTGVGVAPVSYINGTAAIAAAPTATIVDPDSINLAGATIQISGNYQTGQDVLAAVTTGTPITQVFDSSSGTLTLSGIASLADYQTVLRSVSYRTNTTTGSTLSRTLKFLLNDGVASSTPVYQAINVERYNAPPVIGGLEPSPLIFKSHSPALPISNTATITDADSNNLTKLTVQITSGYQNDANGHDMLAFTDKLGITGSFDAITGTLTLSGSAYVGSYREALRTVTFSSSGTNVSTADRVLAILATDDGSPNAVASQLMTRTVVFNLPPVVSGIESSRLVYRANDPAEVISSTVAVTEPDSNNLSKLTVQITTGYQNDANGRDVLAFTNQFGITGSFDVTTGTLTLSGTAYVGYYREALRSVTYSSTGTNVSTADRILTIIATDDGSPNSASSLPATRIVTALNRPPVLGNIESSPLAYNANDPAVAISNTVTLTDPDSDYLAKLTIQITAGYQNDANGQDILSFTNQFGITGSFDAASGTLTLTGSSYMGNYREALRSVTFKSTGTNVSSVNRVLTIIGSDDSSPLPGVSVPILRTIRVSTTSVS